MAARKKSKTGEPSSVRSDKCVIGFEIEATSDLIQQAMSQKTIEDLLKKHMGLPVPRELKVPSACVERGTIRNVEGRVCAPPQAIKSAMLTAATCIKTFDRCGKRLRVSFHVMGQSVPITYEDAIPRMDPVRNSGPVPKMDIRFRPSFHGWKARVAVKFSPDILSPEAIHELLKRGGDVGIGEWRPERNGVFGCWQVSRVLPPSELDGVIKECSVPLVTPKIPEWAMDLELDREALAEMFAGGKANVTEGMKKLKKSKDGEAA